MTAIIDDISDILKKTRKRAGLSRNDLSLMTGVGKTTIYDIEHGKSTIHLENLIKLCTALNIRLSVTPPPEIGDII
jgi:transcriptional regulator with XRE-family HTH domain